jgi:hypothetical protein
LFYSRVIWFLIPEIERYFLDTDCSIADNIFLNSWNLKILARYWLFYSRVIWFLIPEIERYLLDTDCSIAE